LRIARWLIPFGSDKGAMLVRARGIDRAGRPVEVRWRLDADANRGPYVPVLAAVAMVRRWRDGLKPEPGARACSGLVDLQEFQSDFEALGIRAGVEQPSLAFAPTMLAHG
jgi:hypothetical protein